MYLWNVNALVKEFQEDRISEREKMKYYLVTSVLMTLGQQHGLQIGVNNIVYAVVVFLGVVLCYKANSNGDNRNFIDRMVCLGFPIMIRLLPIGIILFGSLATFFSHDYHRISELIGFLGSLYTMVFYFILRHYISKTSSLTAKKEMFI